MGAKNKKSKVHKRKTLLIAIGITALIIALPLFIVATEQINKPEQAITTNPNLDTIVKDTITSINQYGWDSTNKWYHINWYIPTPTQYQNGGHDGQNDLRMYEAMIWYEARHPGDTTFKAQIAAVLPTVKKEWGNTTLAKGWIYFLILRLAKYSGDPSWTNTAKNWATNIYQGVVGSGTVTVPHGPIVDNTGAGAPTCTDGYRVDQNVEDGLALVDAAKRFNNSAWGQAGAQEVNLIQSQAFNIQNHLFYRIICQGRVWDEKARDGEIGQEAEAFIDAGIATNNQTYISTAQQMLDSINNPSTGFIDSVNGGLWFQKDLQTEAVDTGKKVTQQFHILIAFHKANKVMNNKYSAIEQNLTQMLGGKSWAPMPVAGWLYERNPDWTFYKGSENWISTEASGIAMEAAQLILGDQSTIPSPGQKPTNTPTIAQTAIPTSPITTPSYVCAGSSNGICITPTHPTITSTVSPITIPTPIISIIQVSIIPSQSITKTPFKTGKTNNSIFKLILLIISIFESLLKALKL